MTRPHDIGAELAALRRMTVGELREKYLAAFGEETRSWNKDFLRKRIAWRLQELAEGGLSERARRRAEELARDADLRLRAPKGGSAATAVAPRPGRTVTRRLLASPDRRLPMPGAVLTREYRGETVTVTVLESGFAYQGQVYRSLTAVAKAVTGTHWNGYHFFRLARRGGAR
jgi:hypothetical protein